MNKMSINKYVSDNKSNKNGCTFPISKNIGRKRRVTAKPGKYAFFTKRITSQSKVFFNTTNTHITVIIDNTI